MNDFEILIPNDASMSIDVTDKSLYSYDFNSYSLSSLQKVAGATVSNQIKEGLFSQVSKAKLIQKLANKNNTEYVANISDYAKKKLDNGEWSLGIRKKTGETYAVIKDTASGKSKSFITLDARTVNELGNLPELSAIQGQLAAISEQIQDLNKLVKRVEQGQYNDRYAGFFSARQLVIEGLVAQDKKLKNELLLAAIKMSNQTIAKLMLAINQDANNFMDTKIKIKEAERIENLLQNSIGYLNTTIHLNLVIYSVLGEKEALISTLTNYQSFIEQTLLKESEFGKSVAWKIDNILKGEEQWFNELSEGIIKNISNLIEDMISKKIEGSETIKIEAEDM
ncbi:hypothetical protein [Gracilibacillus salinarum]|uniref:Uncharacterized protein n=1 Tax=Gracilibacillus salinarum TaxID=2932255 RepID=A0ABY4GID9_9BACI|nr:hypothetical protein [Gracilibacillus salinarum]UOQ83946.1 hypothetical protein MUN87_14540 [Gracilibacillus salinarum]